MKNAKAIAGVLLIFALGAVVGILGTRMIYEARVEAIASGDWRVREDALVSRLGKRLDLNDKQRDEVRIIIQEARKRLKDIYQQVGPQTMEARAVTNARIRAILTPEQTGRYDILIANKKVR